MNYQKKIYDTVKSYIESMSALDEKEREINKQVQMETLARVTAEQQREELKAQRSAAYTEAIQEIELIETNTGGVHWWTFLGAYNDLGDCTFAQVVRIRDKKARGKALDKDEREWSRRNADLVMLKEKLSKTDDETIRAWMGKKE